MYPFMALSVHFHTFIPSNCLDLPVNVSTVLHVHRCTCSSLYCSACPQMYLFITILFCMSTDVPDHLYTCSVYFFFFGITCTMTFQLISGYLPADPPENILPVYPHASPLPKNKELPVTTTACVPAHICTRS